VGQHDVHVVEHDLEYGIPLLLRDFVTFLVGQDEHFRTLVGHCCGPQVFDGTLGTSLADGVMPGDFLGKLYPESGTLHRRLETKKARRLTILILTEQGSQVPPGTFFHG
jgi:hypothetical protein